VNILLVKNFDTGGKFLTPQELQANFLQTVIDTTQIKLFAMVARLWWLATVFWQWKSWAYRVQVFTPTQGLRNN